MNKGLYLRALKIVWLIYSACGFTIVLIAMLLPAHVILQNTPTCYSIKQFGKECFMCGSTRSFIQAGHGNFSQALHFNKLAFVLFTLIIANFIVFIYCLITNKLSINK